MRLHGGRSPCRRVRLPWFAFGRNQDRAAKYVANFPAFRPACACIHKHSAPHGPRNARQKLETGKARVRNGPHKAPQRSSRVGLHKAVAETHAVRPRPHAQDQAVHAAIGHKDVGARPQNAHRDARLRGPCEKRGDAGRVGLGKIPRRTADFPRRKTSKRNIFPYFQAPEFFHLPESKTRAPRYSSLIVRKAGGAECVFPKKSGKRTRKAAICHSPRFGKMEASRLKNGYAKTRNRREAGLFRTPGQFSASPAISVP